MELLKHILLTEGARDRALEQFMPLLQKRGIQMSISQLKQFLLNKFVTEGNIHNLSLDSNFYLLGVARYYFNGDLTSNKQLNALYPRVRDRFIPEVCQRLDALILILRNSYIDTIGTQWEQPEDFGTLTLQQLFRKYNAKINKALGIEAPKKQKEKKEIEVTREGKASRNYTYDIIYCYQDAQKYNTATTPGAWCITYGQQHYNAYVRRLGIHYVVFRQNGYENIPRTPERQKWIPGEDGLPKPQDTYGNSLICLLQSNNSPEPVYITSRWNHGSSSDNTSSLEADHAYTKEEFLNVIGANESILQKVYDEWSVGREAYKETRSEEAISSAQETRANKTMYLRLFKYMQMMINGGANPLEFQFKDQQGNIEHEVRCKPLGWSREFLNSIYHGDKPMPTKALYIVSIDDEYSTIMDRKVLMIDKFFENCGRNGFWTGKETDTFMVIEAGNYQNKVYTIYDKRRHTLLTVDGVSTFKKTSLEKYGRNSDDKLGYFVVATGIRQRALIDMNKMSPVSIKGRVWFEEICDFQRYVYDRHKIEFPLLGRITRMVYDSASGEVYYYDLATKTLVDMFGGIPHGMYEVTSKASQVGLGNEYAVFSDRPTEPWSWIYTNHINDGKNICYMFKNLETNKIFTIDGITKFKALYKQHNIILYVPYDPNQDPSYANDSFLLYDERLGDLIRDGDGNPIRANNVLNIRGEVIHSDNNDILTFEGRDDNVLYYANGTGKFYYDNINGFIFKYNYWLKGIAFYPGMSGGQFGREVKQYLSKDGQVIKDNDYVYQLPTAEEMAVHSAPLPAKLCHPLKITESFKRIGDIIKEEINKLLNLKFS